MCTRKLSWSLFGGLLPIWSTTALQNHYIWKVCSANQCDALKRATSAASIGQWNGPSSYPWQRLTAWLHNQCFKSLMIGLWSFASSAIFTWPLVSQLTTSVILTTFGKEKCFHNQQKAENAFQEFVESWSMDFYTIGINKLTFCWQNVLMVMVPVFINKDAFEPSYNDLKLTVRNSSYFCTNLIPDTFLSTLHLLGRYYSSSLYLKTGVKNCKIIYLRSTC